MKFKEQPEWKRQFNKYFVLQLIIVKKIFVFP